MLFRKIELLILFVYPLECSTYKIQTTERKGQHSVNTTCFGHCMCDGSEGGKINSYQKMDLLILYTPWEKELIVVAYLGCANSNIIPKIT